MSNASIVQVAVVAAIFAIGLCGVYVLFKIRQHLRAFTYRSKTADGGQIQEVHPDQHEKFMRALSAVEEFQRQQLQLTFFLNRVESDGQVVQNIGLQTGVPVGSLKNAVSSPLISPSDRQTTAVEDRRVPIGVQEVQRVEIPEGISENTRELLHAQPSRSQLASLVQPESKAENGDYIRLRKEFIGQHAQLRFSVLKDWLSINMLAVFRRAFRDWKTAKDLIAIIPSYLEPEAEILNGQVLLIGTRSHPPKLAIPIRQFDPSSDLSQCFDLIENGQTAANTPAVLLRSNGHFEIVSRGTVMQNVLARMDVQVESVPKALHEQAALCLTE